MLPFILTVVTPIDKRSVLRQTYEGTSIQWPIHTSDEWRGEFPRPVDSRDGIAIYASNPQSIPEERTMKVSLSPRNRSPERPDAKSWARERHSHVLNVAGERSPDPLARICPQRRPALLSGSSCVDEYSIPLVVWQPTVGALARGQPSWIDPSAQ